MATKYSMQIDQGSDYELFLTIGDDNGDALNLDGYSFKSSAVSAVTSKTPVFNFSFEVLNQTTNKGIVYMRLSREESFKVNLKGDTKYFYDVKIVTPLNKEDRLFEGDIILRPGITR